MESLSKLTCGVKPDMVIKEKINKLVQQGFSFPEIAKMLGFKSRQAVRYHWKYCGNTAKNRHKWGCA